MNDLIRELTGVDPSLSLDQALDLVGKQRRVRLKVEAATHPPLTPY